MYGNLNLDQGAYKKYMYINEKKRKKSTIRDKDRKRGRVDRDHKADYTADFTDSIIRTYCLSSSSLDPA